MATMYKILMKKQGLGSITIPEGVLMGENDEPVTLTTLVNASPSASFGGDSTLSIIVNPTPSASFGGDSTLSIIANPDPSASFGGDSTFTLTMQSSP